MPIKEEIVGLTSELVRKPSCWDNEEDQRQLGNFIGDWFRKSEITAEVDDLGNVLVNPDAAIILNGHFDVVAPEGEANYDPKLRDGKIIGRGTSDMKGALAVMMKVMKDLHEKHEDLGLVFDVTEEAEYAKCGADVLCERGTFDNTKFLIVGEPSVDAASGESHVQIGSEGAIDCMVRVSTDETPYHAANLHLANNAILVADHYLDGLMNNRKLTVPLERFKQNYTPWVLPRGKGPINIGKIRGGSQPTLTASRCEIHLEKRLFPGETSKEFSKNLKKYSFQFGKKNGAKIGVEVTWNSDPYLTDGSSPLNHFLKLWAKENKLKISFGNGVSDLNKIFNYVRRKKRRSLAAVNLGPGNFPVIHTDREFIMVRDLERFYHLYIDLITEVQNGRGKALITRSAAR